MRSRSASAATSMLRACLTNSSKKLSSRGTSRSRQRGTSPPSRPTRPESFTGQGGRQMRGVGGTSVHELVPESSNRHQMNRTMRVLFNLAAQTLHMDVEGPGVPEVVGPPDVLDEELPGQQPAPAPEEGLEELELLRGQGDGLAANRDLVSGDVHPYRP